MNEDMTTALMRAGHLPAVRLGEVQVRDRHEAYGSLDEPQHWFCRHCGMKRGALTMEQFDATPCVYVSGPISAEDARRYVLAIRAAGIPLPTTEDTAHD